MDIKERIISFARLGEILRDSLAEKDADYSSGLKNLIESQYLKNPWFTPENVRRALNAIANELTEENLVKWTNAYPGIKRESKPVRIGIIMAGNIPLAGFHDFISVLISGNHLLAKTSSKDSDLIRFIGGILILINPEFKNLFTFTEGTLTNFDAVIATGSNNSSRYFEYYFGKYPNIIRKNRNSVSVITGNESETELEALGTDIFSYFGLGCRNVSKIYVPEGYDLMALKKTWHNFADIISHNKYANNYDFNKAVYLVNKEVFYDFGYLLLKEDIRISSPVSVLFYEFYPSQDAVKQQTESLAEHIQCIVGRNNIPFGTSQMPHLWDYADGIDTIDFFLKKNIPGIL
jgi:hypothetical protein